MKRIRIPECGRPMYACVCVCVSFPGVRSLLASTYLRSDAEENSNYALIARRRGSNPRDDGSCDAMFLFGLGFWVIGSGCGCTVSVY